MMIETAASVWPVLLVVAVGVIGSSALASAPGSVTCSGGAIGSGTYKSVTVTGNCGFVPGAVITIEGNLTVADGAALNDHAASTATVTVGGNVLVGKGGIAGLGTYNPFAPHNSSVGGNVIANQPLSMYFSFLTIHGNFVSNGGGGGVTGEFRNYPTKDVTVDGNLIIQGWTGGWIGVIRDSRRRQPDLQQQHQCDQRPRGSRRCRVRSIPTRARS